MEPCASNDVSLELNFFLRSASPNTGSGCEDAAPATFISCDGYDGGEALLAIGAEQVELAFDYELHTPTWANDGDVASALEEFQGGLLGSVADEFGLLSCTGSVRKGRVRSHNSGRMLERGSVLGVSSDPSDVPLDGESCVASDVHCDYRFVIAELHLTNHKLSLTGECNVNTDVGEASRCTSVNGFMTAWVSADESNRRQLSQTDVFTAIENFIAKGYSSDSILGISYLGRKNDQPVVGGATSDNGYRNTTTGSDSAGITPGIISLIAVISVLAVLGVISHIQKRRRRGFNQAEEEAEDIAVVGDDVQEIKRVESIDNERPNEEDTDVSSCVTDDYTMNELQPCFTFETEEGRTSFSGRTTPSSCMRDDNAPVNSEDPSQIGVEVEL